MNDPQTPVLRESDFEAIEAAVMETEKGRWFLAEYARRHRHAETGKVLDAIGNIERMMRRERRPDADRIRLDIGEMKDAIERTKLEIAQIKTDGRADGSRFDTASNELDAIVTQTEAATSDILGAAEKIQEMAWTMREAGVEEEICAAVEDLTTTIYTACSFQDLTGQRTQKVVHVLRYLEHRIDSMIDIWGMEASEVASVSASTEDRGPVLDTRPDAHLLNGPQLAGQGVDQDRVDDMFGATDEPAVAGSDAETDVFAGFDRIEIEAPAEAVEAVEATDPIEEIAVEAAPDTAEAVTGEGEAGEGEIDKAIDALMEISAKARARAGLPADMDDPFEKMTRSERQALLS